MAATVSQRVRAPRLEARAWLRTVGRPGPERWIWAVVAAGWVVLVVNATGWRPFRGAPTTSMGEMPGMSPGMSMDHGTHASPWAPLGHHLLLWVAMVAATMLPLVAGNLRSVGLRSPRGLRTRATVHVAAGWALVWLAAGLVITPAVLLGMATVPMAPLVAVTCAVALGWQLTRVKRVAVARCHRTFAPPLGPAAAPACRRFGVTLGRDCLLTCWPSMVLMTLAAHELLVIVPLAWLSWRDTRRPHNRPGVGTSVLVLLGAGALALAIAA